MPAALTLVDRLAPGDGNVHSYADAGFEPVALVTFGTGNDLDTWANDISTGYGVAGNNLGNGFVGYRMDNGKGIPAGESEIRNDACMGRGAASAADQAAIVSFDSLGETLDWGAGNTAGDDMLQLAIGGGGVDSFVGSFDLPTAGTVTVSGLPFAPTFLMTMTATRATFGSDATDGHDCWGFSDGTNHRSISVKNNLALSTNTRVMIRDDAVTHMNDGAAGVLFRSPVTFTSDGFSLTPDAYPASVAKHVYLAMTGTGTVVVGHDSQKTSTGVKTTTTNSNPTLVLFLSVLATTTNTVTALGDVVFGALTDSGQVGSVGGYDAVGAGTSIDVRRQTMGKCIQFGKFDQTIQAEAGGAVATGGFDLDWTTADATARLFAYAALEVPAPPPALGGGNRWWWWRGY